MKKPSLRFRQVFEHGTHFKVTRPMGNPITIAKSAISPTMQARLRKFAQGGEVRNYQVGGDVAAPADDFPLPEGMTDEPTGAPVLMDPLNTGVETPVFVAPAPASLAPVAEPAAAPATPATAVVSAPAAAPAVAEPAPVSDLVALKPHRRRVRPFEAPESVALRSTAGVGEPAAAEAAAEPAAAEPVAAKPVATEPAAELTEQQKLAAQLRGETQAAIQAEQQRIAKVQEAEIAAADLAADQAKAYQAEVERYQQQVADARKIQKEASDDMAAGRNVGSYFSRLGTWNQIGTALSLAAGAFATGLTGVPNFALQIYNNAIEKDLEKQRDDRNSLWTKFVNAGNTAQEADQLVRASMDKALAARAAQQAAITRNAKAADGFAKFSAELNQKSETTIARIEQSKAVAARARAETVVAEDKPAQEAVKLLRDEVKRMKDLERQKKLDAMAQQELNIKRKMLALAERKATAEEQQAQERQEANVFNVAGLPVTAKDSKMASKAETEVLGQTDLIDLAERTLQTFKEHPKMVYVPMSDARQLAELQLAQLLERYPKSERFTRPLNMTAARVIKNGLQDPTSFKSAVFGNPQMLLRELIENAKNDRKQAILNYSRTGDKYRAQAVKAIEELEAKESENYGVDFKTARK